jgi:hypothetical protein
MDTAEQSHDFTPIGPGTATPHGQRARKITDEEAGLVFQWVAEGLTRPEIAGRLGVTQGSLFDRGRIGRGRGQLAHPSLQHLPRRQGKNGGRPRGPTDGEDDRGPSPELIRQRCLEIQATWTFEVEQLRRYGAVGDRPSPTEIHRVSFGDL